MQGWREQRSSILDALTVVLAGPAGRAVQGHRDTCVELRMEEVTLFILLQ